MYAVKQLSQRGRTGFPKGPSTRYLGTWDLGNRNFSTGLGEVYNY